MSEVRSASARVSGAIEFSVKVIALGVPAFYAMGRLFTEGYWRHFGLPSSLMVQSVEDNLYCGFLSVLLPLARLVGVDPYTPMGYALLIGLGLALFVVLSRLLGSYFGAWSRSRIDAINHWLAERAKERAFAAKQMLLFVSIWSFVAFVFMGMIAAVLVLILPLALASTEGTYQAELADARIRSPAPMSLPAEVDFTVGDGIQSAPVLSCSDRWCVVYQDGSYVALPAQTVTRVRPVGSTKK